MTMAMMMMTMMTMMSVVAVVVVVVVAFVHAVGVVKAAWIPKPSQQKAANQMRWHVPYLIHATID